MGCALAIWWYLVLVHGPLDSSAPPLPHATYHLPADVSSIPTRSASFHSFLRLPSLLRPSRRPSALTLPLPRVVL